MGKRVTVTPYDEAWADDFIKIRDEIKATLGNLVLRIELKDMLALLKKRVMREHRWQYKRPIMLSGCTRRSDSGLWMRMTKSFRIMY